jgi:hypothetical protein
MAPATLSPELRRTVMTMAQKLFDDAKNDGCALLALIVAYENLVATQAALNPDPMAWLDRGAANLRRNVLAIMADTAAGRPPAWEGPLQ